VIAVVVFGLASAMGIPYLFNRSAAPSVASSDPVPTTAESLAMLQTPAGAPTAASASPATDPTPSPTPSTKAAVPPPSAPPTTTAPPAPLSVTLEAEAVPPSLRPNTQHDANPDCYPNGPDVVSRIGDWNQGAEGTITFTFEAPAAGAYAMTVHYVNTWDETREAEIIVNGAAAISPWPTFPNTEAPPTCIDARSPITVTLRQGTNTIRFGNPDSRAPTIDRIVINRP
jgi:hypothetical protein